MCCGVIRVRTYIYIRCRRPSLTAAQRSTRALIKTQTPKFEDLASACRSGLFAGGLPRHIC